MVAKKCHPPVPPAKAATKGVKAKNRQQPLLAWAAA